MLNHHAFILLSEKASAQNCQRALRIFGEWDLSVPRLLISQEIDKRFGWTTGSCQKTINALLDLGILVSLAHGRLSAGGQTLFMIAEQFGWTPRSLADQWQREELQRDRQTVTLGRPPTA
jgi:hypothetical protein